MTADDMGTDSCMNLWTAQTDMVLECIQKNGFSQVKIEYIDKKYEESAWLFKEAYGFFRQKALTMVKPPEGAESPIWLFCNKKWVYVSQDCCLLELSIPKERVILFDREKWQRVLNLAYIGTSAEDEADFEQKMERMGVSDYCSVFQSGFYPYLKSGIKKSWERIFDIKDTEYSNLGAAVWQLRKEDIINVTRF